MRLDRFITLHLVQPWRNIWSSSEHYSKNNEPRTPHQERRTKNQELWSPIPILMFHSISSDPEPGVSPYYRVCTSPATFARQMQLLSDLGYHGVSLAKVYRELGIGNHTQTASLHLGKEQNTTLREPHIFSSQLPSLETESHDSKLVVLTFDDGFRDFYTDAWPILEEHQFTATVYLPTAYIGDNPRQFKGRDCLTWANIEELHQAGIEFGSHTVNHPKLVDLAPAQVEAELRDSKSAIEDHLGHPVDAFCYPYAFPSQNQAFVQQLTDTLVTCGYTTCATTQIGRLRVTSPQRENLYRLLNEAKSRPVGTNSESRTRNLEPGTSSGSTLSRDHSFPIPNSQLPAPNSPFGTPILLPRLPANDCDDNTLLAAKLSGAYDWVDRPQRWGKRLKSLSRS